MTGPQMLAYLRSGLDDPSGTPTPFWSDADCYIALNTAQVQVAADALSGSNEDSKLARAIIVDESLADGATAANTIFMPLCVYDAANSRHVPMHGPIEFIAYTGMTGSGFGDACIYSDKMHTNPASQTYHLVYAKFPVAITASVDCTLDEVCHPSVVESARVILLRKDISTSLSEAIEPDRNKLEVLRHGTQPKTGYQQRDVPYSSK